MQESLCYINHCHHTVAPSTSACVCKSILFVDMPPSTRKVLMSMSVSVSMSMSVSVSMSLQIAVMTSATCAHVRHGHGHGHDHGIFILATHPKGT